MRRLICLFAIVFLIAGLGTLGSSNTRLPAEWEPVQKLILRWPGFPFCGPEEKKAIVEMIREIGNEVRIDVIVNNVREQEDVVSALKIHGVSAKNIVFVQRKGNDIWIRDYGAKFVVDSASRELIGIDWMYQPNRAPLDDAFTPFFCARNGWRTKRLEVLFEGGNFTTSGKGTAFMCDSVYKKNLLLLGLPPRVVKERIIHAFSLRNLVILPSVLREDNKHIDVMAKVISNDTVMVGKYTNADPNGLILEQWVKILRRYFNRVVRIELPPTYMYGDIEIFPTYLNSVIINTMVLVPIYGVEKDARALEIYQQEMPNHTIVGIHSRGLLESAGGAFHCITTTVPNLP